MMMQVMMVVDDVIIATAIAAYQKLVVVDLFHLVEFDQVCLLLLCVEFMVR
jgi:hypothetical protein